MNIAIIEYASDIKEAEGLFPPKECLYLSVSAEASYHLLQKGIRFITDEEVLSPAELRALGDENCAITERWACKAEAELQAQAPCFRERDFTPFLWNIYWLKILVDAVRIRLAVLERLIEKEKPSLIGAPEGCRPEAIHDLKLFFHKQDSLYGALVEELGRAKGITVINWIILQAAACGADYGLQPDKFAFWRNSLKRIKAKGLYEYLVVAGRYRSSKSNVLIDCLGYDIKPLRYALSDTFNFYLQSPLNIRSLHTLAVLRMEMAGPEIPSIAVDDRFLDLDPTGERITDGILGLRLKAYADRYIATLWDRLNYVEAVDAQKDFKVFICGGGGGQAFNGMVQSHFKRANKPVFNIQHGSYGFALNTMAVYSDFRFKGVFMSWGEGTGEMYNDLKDDDLHIVPTGSHVIETVARKRSIRRKIKKICYVPFVTLMGYAAYYNGGQPCLDSRMILDEMHFLSALKPYTGSYEITYKIAPGGIRSPVSGDNPIISWVQDNLPGVRIAADPLISVIHDFDLFIIDFPSTALVQAAASGAEILVYIGNPYYVMTSEARSLLAPRAVMGLDEDDFASKISTVLDGGKVISNVDDMSFLEKYGVYLNDGKSLDRMASRIMEVAI
ncbi:MAG: hypothetical protein HQL08_01010 [Nitrospirae bacterium]|nr:hypothetical protein [Nitrospirota bacterium]